MSNVLEETIAKDGSVLVRFNPTAKMIVYAMFRAKNQDKTEAEVCELAKISPQALSRWRSQYGSHFITWLEEEIELHQQGNEAAVLEAVGMSQALRKNNYQYWRDMARKHGVIQDEVKTQNITINTDFSAISIGGDFEQQRRRILQEALGLADTGGDQVAIPAPSRKPESKGSRTSALPEITLEVSDSLGSDRGLAEQGTPVPAVPK